MSVSEDLVPPLDSSSPRTVIFLFDGTGDKIDNDCTNIVDFGKTLYKHPFDDIKQESNYPKDHPNVIEGLRKQKQVVLYRPGIGTWRPSTAENVIPLYGKASKIYDKALANNFHDHVLDAYMELMELYQEGDKLCFFGFSRGAYTARALAGMIAMFGLLPSGSKETKRIREQYFAQDNAVWTEETRKAFREKIRQFRVDNPDSRDVFIEFLGVWDTVNSVGIFSGLRLPYTASNWRVRKFRHAVALDERRARFDRSMWSRQKMDSDPAKKPTTDVLEVWFAGVHCDVGGGSVQNGTMPNLANIPLRWMIRECFKTETGILFRRDRERDGIEKFGLKSSHLYPHVHPRSSAAPLRPTDAIQTPKVLGWFSGWRPDSSPKETYPHLSEEEHDRQDALAPIYDRLEIDWLTWYPLEMWAFKKWDPVKHENSRVRNWWRGREIHVTNTEPKGWKIQVHRTVKTRMLAPSGEKYVPKATLGDQTFSIDSEHIEWVD